MVLFELLSNLVVAFSLFDKRLDSGREIGDLGGVRQGFHDLADTDLPAAGRRRKY